MSDFKIFTNDDGRICIEIYCTLNMAQKHVITYILTVYSTWMVGNLTKKISNSRGFAHGWGGAGMIAVGID